MKGRIHARIKIDNGDYETDKLSDEAKAQVVRRRFCEQDLACTARASRHRLDSPYGPRQNLVKNTACGACWRYDSIQLTPSIEVDF